MNEANLHTSRKVRLANTPKGRVKVANSFRYSQVIVAKLDL